MVKVFTTNENNKIEFTKEELELLLNEVWRDGYNSHSSYWWTSPSITTPYYTYTGSGTGATGDSITITCGNESCAKNRG